VAGAVLRLVAVAAAASKTGSAKSSQGAGAIRRPFCLLKYIYAT